MYVTLLDPAQSEKSRETEAGKGGQEKSCRHGVTCFQERIVFGICYISIPLRYILLLLTTPQDYFILLSKLKFAD